MGNAPVTADSRQPYAALGSDVWQIFNTDSSQTILTTVIVDNIVPWHRVTCFGPCTGSPADPIDFYDLKSVNFSVNNPERRPYFHYAVWAFEHTTVGACSSGLAELQGNDLIISLGCGGAPTEATQRGTFMHELGHNIALTHNGNDSPNVAARSTIHQSVMNYRYQFGGIPVTGRHTYSSSSACDSCSTSPKQACIDCRAGAGCASRCGPACDCSLQEWSSINMYSGGSEWSDGSAVAGTAASGATADNTAQTKTQGSAYTGPLVPKLSASERGARVAALKTSLLGRGQVEGRDFEVLRGGQTIVSKCQ